MNSLRQSESFACPISLREFQAGDERAFARLNQAWIEKYFRLEENDRATLENPRKHILENGGQIFVAIAGTYVTGCVALVRIDNRTYEVVKMAVEEPFQRRGVGGTLMTAAIEWARNHGARRLWLETNHILAPAIKLYESCGFRHLPRESWVVSPYQRSDAQMELLLDDEAASRTVTEAPLPNTPPRQSDFG